MKALTKRNKHVQHLQKVENLEPDSGVNGNNSLVKIVEIDQQMELSPTGAHNSQQKTVATRAVVEGIRKVKVTFTEDVTLPGFEGRRMREKLR